jgi:hypothetical protein
MNEIAMTSVLPLTALVTAFLLSTAVALVYARLHRDVPNTRPFAQTLAMAGIVSAMIVLSIGDSIARGIGLVGALTVIRFRSDLKDPRDLIFAFASLATGVAAGSYAWAVAVGGTFVFLAATVLVSRPWFAKSETFDSVLSLRTAAGQEPEAIGTTLRAYCRSFELVRVRQGTGAVQEHAYQVRLKQPGERIAFVQAMKAMAGVDDALLVALDEPGNR